MARRTSGESPERTWQALIDTFHTHRALWVAQLEAIVVAEHNEEVRAHLAAGQREARAGLGGSVPNAILVGLMVQWLVDPATAPSGAEVVAEMRALKP
jgi:vancomycin permeability regulator SanA